MSHDEITRRMRAKGLDIPQISATPIQAAIPDMKILVTCPHCGEPIPVTVRLTNIRLQIGYPQRRQIR